MRGLQALEELLLPPRCAACLAPADATLLCAGCSAGLASLALPDLAAEELTEGVVAVGAYAYDGAVRDLIRGVKVGGRFAVAAMMGRLLEQQVPLPPARHVLRTWVPASPRRRRARGFDLPQLLAGQHAVAMLATTGERPDQTVLTPAARRRSPRGAYVARSRAPDSVVLVDDVRTTGATATSAALALRAAGARRVLVATFAVAGDDARGGSAP